MAQRRPAYNETERERIRRGMLRYKDQHEVGVPTLQLRIAEAMGDSPDRVPLKSLQRFLAATHRTDDALVGHCAGFLSKVAPPPAEDELGAALAAFLGPDAQDLRRFAGVYRSGLRPFRQQAAPPARARPMVVTTGQIGLGRLAAVQAPAFEMPWSTLTLEQAAHEGFLRAIETVFAPQAEDAGTAGEDPPPERKSWLGNTGIFVPCGGSGYLLMVRSYIDARFYFLTAVSEDGAAFHGTMMTGDGLLPLPALRAPDVWRPDFEVRFVRHAA